MKAPIVQKHMTRLPLEIEQIDINPLIGGFEPGCCAVNDARNILQEPAEVEPVTVGEWIAIPGGDDCRGSAGRPGEVGERPADPTPVVRECPGGGGCGGDSFAARYNGSCPLRRSDDGRVDEVCRLPSRASSQATLGACVQTRRVGVRPFISLGGSTEPRRR